MKGRKRVYQKMVEEKVWYTVDKQSFFDIGFATLFGRDKANWPIPLPDTLTITIKKLPKEQWLAVDETILIQMTVEDESEPVEYAAPQLNKVDLDDPNRTSFNANDYMGPGIRAYQAKIQERQSAMDEKAALKELAARKRG